MTCGNEALRPHIVHRDRMQTAGPQPTVDIDDKLRLGEYLAGYLAAQRDHRAGC